MTVWAIDMDGTLTRPEIREWARGIFDSRSNFVVVHTARPEYMRQKTVDELRAMDVPYHALVMGKVRADYYVDDKAYWPGVGVGSEQPKRREDDNDA